VRSLQIADTSFIRTILTGINFLEANKLALSRREFHFVGLYLYDR
jgi:hypothetical protein